MIHHGNDLIAAVATPPGRGAVALVRLSGPGAIAAVSKIWRGPCLGDVNAGRQIFGRIIEPGDDGMQPGEVVDEVLAVGRHAPRSFTGEEMVEISCHGGVLVTRRILDLILRAGARMAEPGEFTRRAFENGRIDLAEAESVIDLINAGTDLARRAAAAQLEGRISKLIETLRGDLIQVLAHVEAAIDFPEEGIDPDTGALLLARVAGCRQRIGELLRSERRGRVLRDGFRVAIVGPPNAGKSSLLNALLGRDRAIVSAEPGTTRDFIEETLDFDGAPVRLIDTAGLREEAGEIELAGMQRSRELALSADLVILLRDGNQPPPPPEDWLNDLPAERRMIVLNKSDLPRNPLWGESAPGAISISCLTGEGLDILAGEVGRAALGGDRPADPLLAVGARHAEALRRAGERLARAEEEMRAGLPPEVVAIDLRAALDAAGEVIGTVNVEEILGDIFARFCIGK